MRTSRHGRGEDAERVEPLGQDFDEAISFIKASITKMDKLINAVLKLSREGRREFKPEYIDMSAMLRDAREERHPSGAGGRRRP